MNEQVQNAQRIYTNIATLLAEGTFPGKFAPALNEAVEFLAHIIKSLGEVNEQQEAGDSDRNEEDADRLASSSVPDPGR